MIAFKKEKVALGLLTFLLFEDAYSSNSESNRQLLLDTIQQVEKDVKDTEEKIALLKDITNQIFTAQRTPQGQVATAPSYTDDEEVLSNTPQTVGMRPFSAQTQNNAQSFGLPQAAAAPAPVVATISEEKIFDDFVKKNQPRDYSFINESLQVTYSERWIPFLTKGDIHNVWGIINFSDEAKELMLTQSSAMMGANLSEYPVQQKEFSIPLYCNDPHVHPTLGWLYFFKDMKDALIRAKKKNPAATYMPRILFDLIGSPHAQNGKIQVTLEFQPKEQGKSGSSARVYKFTIGGGEPLEKGRPGRNLSLYDALLIFKRYGFLNSLEINTQKLSSAGLN